MDVDESPDSVDTSALEWITLFDITPSRFPWRDPIPEEIEARRNQMSDKLIFDLLLASARIPQPDTLFPPTDMESLRRLLDAIQNSSYDMLKKDCVVYWLLKWHQDGKAKAFREARCLPPQFVTLADAYWLLDTGIDVEKAVSMLSDSRITPEYPSKVLQALSLSEDPHALIVKYVRTAKPSLSEPEDVDLYTLSLAESCPSLMEAWQFQRTFPEDGDTRPRLIGKILDWCLSPKPRSGPLSQLLAFPFSAFEQSLVHKYALDPPPTCPYDSIPVVQDLVCLRLIQSGQHAAAVKLNCQFVSSTSRPSDSMKKAIRDRKEMMEDIMAAIPDVERELLEVELEQLAEGKGGMSSSLGSESWTNLGNGMGASREDLRASRPSLNGFNAPPTRLPARPAGTTPIMTIPQRNGQTPFDASLPSAPNGAAHFPPAPSLFASAAGHNLSSAHAGPSAQPFSPMRFVQTPLTGAQQPFPTFSKPAPSLFSSVGSANMSRNAFYNPAPTNGVKRSLDSDIPRPPPEVDEPPPPPIHVEDDDANMEVDEEPPSGLSYSLFGTSKVTDEGRRQGGKPVVRTETELKMPPGAFIESDDEEQVSRRTTRTSSRKKPSPPAPAPKRTRSRKAIPGALIGDEEEEGDEVAPLPASPPPPSKRPSRKNKTSSRASSIDSEEPTQPRRSNRLLVQVSPSPEPSPKKTRRGAKTTAKAEGSTTKSGPRKRKS